MNQTQLTINHNICNFWGYSSTNPPNKLIWRYNGTSNVLDLISASEDGESFIYANKSFTYPNIGYTSDNDTEYVIDIYPADYEDSGTHTMIVGSIDGLEYGYKNILTNDYPYGELYPNKLYGKEISHFGVSGSSFELHFVGEEQYIKPTAIELNFDNNLSCIAMRDPGYGTHYLFTDFGVSSYIETRTKDGILIKTKEFPLVGEMATMDGYEVKIAAIFNFKTKKLYTCPNFKGLNLITWSGNLDFDNTFYGYDFENVFKIYGKCIDIKNFDLSYINRDEISVNFNYKINLSLKEIKLDNQDIGPFIFLPHYFENSSHHSNIQDLFNHTITIGDLYYRYDPYAHGFCLLDTPNNIYEDSDGNCYIECNNAVNSRLQYEIDYYDLVIFPEVTNENMLMYKYFFDIRYGNSDFEI